jgi:hypothetical protein
MTHEQLKSLNARLVRLGLRPLTRAKWEERERRIAAAKRAVAAGEQVLRRDFGRILRVR